MRSPAGCDRIRVGARIRCGGDRQVRFGGVDYPARAFGRFLMSLSGSGFGRSQFSLGPGCNVRHYAEFASRGYKPDKPLFGARFGGLTGFDSHAGDSRSLS